MNKFHSLLLLQFITIWYSVCIHYFLNKYLILYYYFTFGKFSTFNRIKKPKIKIKDQKNQKIIEFQKKYTIYKIKKRISKFNKHIYTNLFTPN